MDFFVLIVFYLTWRLYYPTTLSTMRLPLIEPNWNVNYLSLSSAAKGDRPREPWHRGGGQSGTAHVRDLGQRAPVDHYLALWRCHARGCHHAPSPRGVWWHYHQVSLAVKCLNWLVNGLSLYRSAFPFSFLFVHEATTLLKSVVFYHVIKSPINHDQAAVKPSRQI